MKFDVSKNRFGAAGGKALAGALKGNNVMRELNISSNYLGYNSNRDSDMSGIIAISNAIPTMGALASLDLSQNGISESESSRIKEACEAKSISLRF